MRWLRAVCEIKLSGSSNSSGPNPASASTLAGSAPRLRRTSGIAIVPPMRTAPPRASLATGCAMRRSMDWLIERNRYGALRPKMSSQCRKGSSAATSHTSHMNNGFERCSLWSYEEAESVSASWNELMEVIGSKSVALTIGRGLPLAGPGESFRFSCPRWASARPQVKARRAGRLHAAKPCGAWRNRRAPQPHPSTRARR